MNFRYEITIIPDTAPRKYKDIPDKIRRKLKRAKFKWIESVKFCRVYTDSKFDNGVYIEWSVIEPRLVFQPIEQLQT